MDSISVAISQTPGEFGDPEAALHLLDRDAAQARDEGADILVLPELFLTGYNLGQVLVQRLAEAVDGPLIAAAQALARRHGIALVFGYPQRSNAGIANAAMFIGADGETLLDYRKAHLFGALDQGMFDLRGDVFPVLSYRQWRIGLAICYDIEFPETARLMALAGADCLLVPTALMEPYDIVPRAVIPARAYENQLYLAYANHCGAEADIAYIGQSCICGPDGSVLAAAGRGPELIVATFNHDHLREVRARDPLLADRRPALYRALTESSR